MKKYLIVNPFGIGDVLFTFPFIRALKSAYPHVFIGYWCNKRTQDLFSHASDIDMCFALSRGDLKKIFQQSKRKAIKEIFHLLRGIKKEKFDVCVDFSLDTRYSLLAQLLGIKKRVGFDYKKRGRFLTDSLRLESYSTRHMVEYYLSLLNLLNIQPTTREYRLSVSNDAVAKARSFLSRGIMKPDQLIIGIAPGAGASWGKDAAFKHWSAIKFAQLAEKITRNLNAKVVLLGEEKEKYIADIILNTLKGNVIDLVGKTSLKEAISAIANLQLLVANDGGMLHLAVALGVPTVSIFGPVDDLVYGPYPPSRNHIVIKKELSCRPCYRNFRFTGCLNDRRCTKDIAVDEVWQAVKAALIHK